MTNPTPWYYKKLSDGTFLLLDANNFSIGEIDDENTALQIVTEINSLAEIKKAVKNNVEILIPQ